MARLKIWLALFLAELLAHLPQDRSVDQAAVRRGREEVSSKSFDRLVSITRISPLLVGSAVRRPIRSRG
jgi:hypothetical protein